MKWTPGTHEKGDHVRYLMLVLWLIAGALLCGGLIVMRYNAVGLVP